MNRKILVLITAVLLCAAVIVQADEIHDAVDSNDVARVEALLSGDEALIELRNRAGQTPLHRAAEAGHVSMIGLLLSRDAEVDAGDNEGTTPLQLTALFGHLEALKALEAGGGSVSNPDNFGMTALHWAALRGHLEVARYLIEKEVPLDGQGGQFGSTPVMFAVSSGNAELVDLLVAAGADINASNEGGYTLLHSAASGGMIEIARKMIESGVPVDQRSNDGTTPFYLAAMRGQVELMRFLEEQGADIFAENNSGETALVATADHGRVEAMEYLLDRGLDINSQESHGASLMLLAVWGGHLDMVELLISHGKDINEENENGSTILYTAGYAGTPELFAGLFSLGADMDAATGEFGTPLHNAARGGNIVGAQILIERDVDLNLRNDAGATALYNAVLHNQNDMVRLLLDAGAETDLQGERWGYSPLHLAAIDGRKDVAEMLAGAGAKISLKDKNDQTPLHLAARHGHKDVADYLMTQGVSSEGVEMNWEGCQGLTQSLGDSDAHIWYLGHSGWAVKTASRLLIFDYYNAGSPPANPCLANGHILPSELKDLDVYVFVSHVHGDHYSAEIFDWTEEIPNITHILGFEPPTDASYTFVGPRQVQTFDGMKVSTIESNDSGVGFLVEVDGICLYHAGDHANRLRDFSGPYTAEIDYIGQITSKIDIAFLPVTGCNFGDNIAVQMGNDYFMENLETSVVFPMHAGSQGWAYRTYADHVTEKGYDCDVVCGHNRGDRFFFKKDKIM